MSRAAPVTWAPMMQAFAPPIAAPAPGRQFQWLGFDGAELPGSNGSGMPCPADPRARITNRTKLSDKQLDALVSAFDREPMPSPEQRDALAHKLDLPPRSVQIWFQNRRQRSKPAIPKDDSVAASLQQLASG